MSKVGARGLEGCFPFAKFQMQDARFLAPGDGALFQAPCKARESRALARRSQGDKLQGREASERASERMLLSFPAPPPMQKSGLVRSATVCLKTGSEWLHAPPICTWTRITCQTSDKIYDCGMADMRERSEGGEDKRKRKKKISAHFPRRQQKVRINAKPSICATPLHTMPNVGTSKLHIQ